MPEELLAVPQEIITPSQLSAYLPPRRQVEIGGSSTYSDPGGSPATDGH